MNYYLDTEFIEGFHKPLFGKKRHFIDLISIGIVGEGGREFYAVSNEFNPADADEWVFKNVLLPLHEELTCIERPEMKGMFSLSRFDMKFRPEYEKSLRQLLKKYGKTNRQIAQEIVAFVYGPALDEYPSVSAFYGADEAVQAWLELPGRAIKFFGYYADYDWVLLCSLFGRMIDLPKGFPMYCRDLKQELDHSLVIRTPFSAGDWKAKHCPDPVGEHNALVDARWNRLLHTTLKGYLLLNN